MTMQIERALAIILGAGLLAACQPKEPPVVTNAPPAQPVQTVQSAPSSEPRPVIFPPPPTIPDDAARFAPTRVLSDKDAERLRNNQGMTLQWITWDKRSPVLVEVDDRGVWMLTSEIRGDDGGAMKIEGYITEIGSDYFLIDAEITIMGTPNASRFCDLNKTWRFAVTQNRKYYRLREFEWCDGLTDYIDIYF